MADKRITDFTEAASAGADYFLVTDSASDGVKKIKPANITPAFTGDVTKTAGGTVTTIAGNSVTNAKAAQMAAGTIKANLTGALASASDNTINAVMDAAFGSTQGAIAYRGASGWSSLAPGTSGQFMQTSGPSANPIWQTIPGGGNMLSSTYDPTGKLTDAFDSANTAFLPSGTGAIARTARSKMRDICDLRDFASTFDGAVDNTSDFNDALVESVAAGTGLRLPAGIIRLTATVVIPQNAKIIGSGMGNGFNSDNSPVTPSAANGTWLHFDHAGVGMLSDDHAVPTSNGVRMFKDFGTYRSQPTPTGGAFTPGTFDFDFWCQSCADVYFDNLMTLNPTNGFYIAQSGSSPTPVVSGRINFSGIRGQPLGSGIVVDYSYDVCRFNDIHFWPYWSRAASVYDYTVANAAAIQLGRCDNPYLDGLFFYAFRKGVSFYNAPDTADAPGGTCGNFSIGTLQSDFGGAAVVVESGADAVTGYISDLVGYSAGTGVSPAPTLSPGLMLLGTNADIRVGSFKCALGQNKNVTVAGSGNSLRVEHLTSLLTGQASGGDAHIDIATGNVVSVGPRPKVDASGAFRSGTGTMDCVLGQGNSTGTTDGSGDVTFTHGLGMTPGRASVVVTSTGSVLLAYVTSITSTSITFRSYGTTTGSAIGSGAALTFDWEAYA